MPDVLLKIKLLSHWSAGSGRSRGADADELVIKDKYGLPYLPGRTVKGLLREAMQTCEDAGQVPEGTTHYLFGTPSIQGNPAGSKPGMLQFRNATLPAEEKNYLKNKVHSVDNNLIDAMYDIISFTKLDDEGIAQDKTLRTIELTIPLELETKISWKGPAADPNWISYLQKACTLLRGLGAHRNRGFGRCLVTIQKG